MATRLVGDATVALQVKIRIAIKMDKDLDARANADDVSDAMDITLPLDKMTTAEKLRAMEALWADLTRNEADFESPAWHEQILKEREAGVQSGQASFIDWETAKKQLRDKLA